MISRLLKVSGVFCFDGSLNQNNRFLTSIIFLSDPIISAATKRTKMIYELMERRWPLVYLKYEVRSISINYLSAIIDFRQTSHFYHIQWIVSSVSLECSSQGSGELVFDDADHDPGNDFVEQWSIDQKSINKLLILSFVIRSSWKLIGRGFQWCWLWTLHYLNSIFDIDHCWSIIDQLSILSFVCQSNWQLEGGGFRWCWLWI